MSRICYNGGLLDVTSPKGVEVVINDKIVWVNVDGVCLFRACKINHLTVKDNRLFQEGTGL